VRPQNKKRGDISAFFVSRGYTTLLKLILLETFDKEKVYRASRLRRVSAGRSA